MLDEGNMTEEEPNDINIIHNEKQRRRRTQKKAPGAPKRGKSPYILFSIDKRELIKSQLPSDAKVTEIMTAIAAVWSEMTDEQKLPWVQAAELDKQRYDEEMASYDGPLRVPNKRLKKHPDAPKRASSAYIFYSQIMRPRIKEKYPELKNTDISKHLGEAWSKASMEQKNPFILKENEDRARYRKEMDEWNASKADRDELERQKQLALYTSNITMFETLQQFGTPSAYNNNNENIDSNLELYDLSKEPEEIYQETQ